MQSTSVAHISSSAVAAVHDPVNTPGALRDSRGRLRTAARFPIFQRAF
jgi:hypothetical protein